MTIFLTKPPPVAIVIEQKDTSSNIYTHKLALPSRNNEVVDFVSFYLYVKRT